MEIAQTIGRVERHTPGDINARIYRDIECTVMHYASHPEGIDDRLEELDREWDIERTLETQASGMVLGGLVLSVLRGRKWLGLAGISGYFLLQHALKGWSPPVSIYRRLGVRTAHEIEIERTALKSLRGDFDGLRETREPMARARQALEAAAGAHRSFSSRSRRKPVKLSPMDESPAQDVAAAPALHEHEPGRSATGDPRGRHGKAARPGFSGT